jgi:hypothetical protein
MPASNKRCAMGEAAPGAFWVFFTQSPSRIVSRLSGAHAEGAGRNNACSFFGIEQIPSMQQIRNLPDAVSPPHFAVLLKDLVEPILADGGLVSHRVLDGRLLMTLDGTEHHCAEAIDCPQCSARTLAHGPRCQDRCHLPVGDFM